MQQLDFVHELQFWYENHKRDLPWRNNRNPYHIWLSEIILQQTRVAQGLPYFNRFIKAYPEIENLASAEEQDVLRLWQGLGYYSRARNLHSTAKYLVQNYSGKFPQSYNNLLTLKGIGTYTAAAIASFAFGEKVAVVDGNVYRVLSRYFGVSEDICSSKAKKTFAELANSLLPDKDSENYNQAIMEFGALQCVPASPDCGNCPLALDCFARKNKIQNKLPVKAKSKEKKLRHFNYFLLRKNNKVFLSQRKDKDIWNGLYEFKLMETLSPINLEAIKCWMTENAIEGKIIKESEPYKQVLSHQVINARFWEIEVDNYIASEHQATYFTVAQMNKLPKPVLINNYLKKHIF